MIFCSMLKAVPQVLTRMRIAVIGVALDVIDLFLMSYQERLMDALDVLMMWHGGVKIQGGSEASTVAIFETCLRAVLNRHLCSALIQYW